MKCAPREFRSPTKWKCRPKIFRLSLATPIRPSNRSTNSYKLMTKRILVSHTQKRLSRIGWRTVATSNHAAPSPPTYITHAHRCLSLSLSLYILYIVNLLFDDNNCFQFFFYLDVCGLIAEKSANRTCQCTSKNMRQYGNRNSMVTLKMVL